jgi:hypothetical protein
MESSLLFCLIDPLQLSLLYLHIPGTAEGAHRDPEIVQGRNTQASLVHPPTSAISLVSIDSPSKKCEVSLHIVSLSQTF